MVSLKIKESKPCLLDLNEHQIIKKNVYLSLAKPIQSVCAVCWCSGFLTDLSYCCVYWFTNGLLVGVRLRPESCLVYVVALVLYRNCCRLLIVVSIPPFLCVCRFRFYSAGLEETESLACAEGTWICCWILELKHGRLCLDWDEKFWIWDYLDMDKKKMNTKQIIIIIIIKRYWKFN